MNDPVVYAAWIGGAAVVLQLLVNVVFQVLNARYLRDATRSQGVAAQAAFNQAALDAQRLAVELRGTYGELLGILKAAQAECTGRVDLSALLQVVFKGHECPREISIHDVRAAHIAWTRFADWYDSSVAVVEVLPQEVREQLECFYKGCSSEPHDSDCSCSSERLDWLISQLAHS